MHEIYIIIIIYLYYYYYLRRSSSVRGAGDEFEKKLKTSSLRNRVRMNKKCRKWITRDKLRRCENNVVYQDINIETEKLVAEDDENDVYIFEHLHSNENSGVNIRRYPARRKVNVPDRYGNPVLI